MATSKNRKKTDSKMDIKAEEMLGWLNQEQGPKELFQLIQSADEKQEAITKARAAALKMLREKLGDTRTFTHNGRIYQIRTRGKEPYLVELSTPRGIKSL